MFGATFGMRVKTVNFVCLITVLLCSCQGVKENVRVLGMDEVRKLGGKSGFEVYAGNPVLKPGPEGTWDAGALGSMSVLKVEDVYHMYYEAWGRRSEKNWDATEYNTLQIGHATSKDGVHWVKDKNNPVLPKGDAGEWDRDGTWDPFVLFENGVFKMWYGGGNKECDWAFAVSQDGSHFTKRGRISRLGGVEDDHVVHDGNAGRYFMYYWDRKYEPLALFRAHSTNETDFDFAHADGIRIDGEPYPAMYKFSHVIRDDAVWYMFYADFVRPHCPSSKTKVATSQDGLHWTLRNKNVLNGHDAEVLEVEKDLYLMYFGPNGYFDRKDCDIRLSVYNGKLSDLAVSKR